MDFSLSDEQRMLAKSATRFLEKEYAFAARRALTESDLGFGRENWARFAEFGWLGIGIPEEQGGVGGGPVEIAILMEAFGRHLVVEPYFASVVLGGGLLRRSGKRAAGMLGRLASGALTLAFAHGEPQSRFELAHVETRAERMDGGFKLSGHKAVALHAQAADQIVVSARTSGDIAEAAGISLFLVPRNATGLSLAPYRTVDGSRAAEVKLNGVAAGRDALLGELDAGHAIVERVVEEAIVALSAEAVGAMAAMLDLTSEYLKTRKQFGVPIGSFQVLQHRLVDMFMAHQLAQSTMQAAVRAIDDDDPAYRARMAAAAKMQAGRAGRLVGQEAVQLHGGMGMTDELALGSYFKRLTAIDATLGNADWHQRRFAALSAL